MEREALPLQSFEARVCLNGAETLFSVFMLDVVVERRYESSLSIAMRSMNTITIVMGS